MRSVTFMFADASASSGTPFFWLARSFKFACRCAFAEACTRDASSSSPMTWSMRGTGEGDPEIVVVDDGRFGQRLGRRSRCRRARARRGRNIDVLRRRAAACDEKYDHASHQRDSWRVAFFPPSVLPASIAAVGVEAPAFHLRELRRFFRFLLLAQDVVAIPAIDVAVERVVDAHALETARS